MEGALHLGGGDVVVGDENHFEEVVGVAVRVHTATHSGSV